MKPKICTVVTGNNLKDFLQNLEKVQKISEMVELRVDHINDLELKDIVTIKRKVKKESIFTCRRIDEGGSFKGTEKQRIEILQEAIKFNFNHVDIELSSINHFNVLKHHNSQKIIISYHNFKETPEGLFLKTICKRIKRYSPDIIKIATHVKNDYDNGILFRLMVDDSIDSDRIVIGMGEKGKITRIIGPLLGNFLTYAALTNQDAMHGQLSFSELQSIYRLLNLSNN